MTERLYLDVSGASLTTKLLAVNVSDLTGYWRHLVHGSVNLPPLAFTRTLDCLGLQVLQSHPEW